MSGPFETEAEAMALPAVRAIYAGHDRHPVVGGMQPHVFDMLSDALADAGVQVGAYDSRILHWLARWEPTTGAVVAGFISRAARQGYGGPEPAKLAAIREVLARTLTDECADRQYALERIEQIADATGVASGPELSGGAYVSADDLRTALDALSVAADDKRDRAEACPDCDGAPAGSADICGACEHRLHMADEYDALAAKLTGDTP